MSELIDSKEFQSVFTLMQSNRMKIMYEITKEPMWIRQISKHTNIPERLVAFHMATLAEHGLVEGDYQIVSSGHGAKFYKPTKRYFELVKKVTHMLEDVTPQP